MQKLIYIILLAVLFSAGALVRPSSIEAKPSVQVYNSKPIVIAFHQKSKSVVNIQLLNLRGVKKVTYTLTYQADGISQGVFGNFDVTSNRISREEYLGTCSGNVCTPHKNVKKIKLEVTFTFSDSSTQTKIVPVH